MDFLRPMTVRNALAAATALCVAAGFGAAGHAQDERGAVSQGGYAGPYLTWAGKQPAAAPPSELTEARYAPAPDYAPSRYVPQSPRSEPPPARPSGPLVSDAPPARYASATYAPQPQSAPPSEAPPARYASATHAPQPQPAPPPVAPATAAAPSPDQGDDGAPDLFPPPEPAPAQAAPAHALAPAPATKNAQPAAAPAPVQPAQAQSAAQRPAQGTTGVRLYSLHRAYGMSPDPIPEPTEGHTVLIAAPDHSSAAADQGDDGDQEQDDGRKHAAHGDDAGDGPSGDN
jgi:hypothetical protein